MATVCPTVTTNDPHIYRQQVEKLLDFATRIHIDIADGVLAPVELMPPEKLWLPEGLVVDIHVMYQDPSLIIEELILLKPRLVVLHAEADGNFVAIADRLHDADIHVGLALLAHTKVDVIKSVINDIDHVLVFSGNLGHFGGHADMSLLAKVSELKSIRPELEIGWDGGINEQNARQLVDAGVDVLNVGGFIQKSSNPQNAYATLIEIINNPNSTNEQETINSRT